MVNALAKLKLKTEFILNARKTVVDDSRFSGISFYSKTSILLFRLEAVLLPINY